MRFRKQPCTHTGVEETPAVWRRPSGRTVHNSSVVVAGDSSGESRVPRGQGGRDECNIGGRLNNSAQHPTPARPQDFKHTLEGFSSDDFSAELQH